MKLNLFTISVCSLASTIAIAGGDNSVVKSFQVKEISFNGNETNATVQNKPKSEPSEISAISSSLSKTNNNNKNNTEEVKPVVYQKGNFSRYGVDGRVTFKLKAGLLKPQLIELLLNHRYVDSDDDVQWLASSNFVWPNSHLLKGKTIDHVLNELLKPYRLVADFKGNGTVVIDSI